MGAGVEALRFGVFNVVFPTQGVRPVEPGAEGLLSSAESENLAFFIGRFLEGVIASGCCLLS